MVSNVSFTSSAIRYLNNEPVYKKNESIINDAKEAAKSIPLSAGFFLAIKSFPDRKLLRFSKKSIDIGKSAPGVIGGYQKAFSEIAKEGANLTKVGLKDFFSKKGFLQTFDNFKKVNIHFNPAFETIKESGKIAKLLKPVTDSGIGKALKLPQLGNLCKRTGAGFAAIIEGGMELLSEVGPAFAKGGLGEGVKQLGKSALKVGASTLGFVLGEAGGQTIGAAIGSAICPGIGTVIGGFLGGIFGGMFASNVAGNTVKKFTGKAFSETQAEKEKEQQAIAVSQDANVVNELKQATMEKLAQKQQAGKLDEDDIAMVQILQSEATPFGSLTKIK